MPAEVGVGADGFGGGEPVGSGHAQVHQYDVRVVEAGEFDGLGAVGCLGDDLEVLAGVDEDPEGPPKEGLVIGEEHTDRHDDAGRRT